MSLGSLYYFSKYVMGFRDMQPQPHRELCWFLETYGDGDVLILLPRGTFKSSVTSVAYPVWRWLKDRDRRFLLTSAELANSKGFLGLIRDNLEGNEVFRTLFGDWTDNGGKAWHQTSLALGGRKVLKAENSIHASSLDVSKVSQHYDHAIIDDIVNDKTVTSSEQIEKVEEYLQGLLPILDPATHSGDPDDHGPRTFVGTRWHFDDPYGRMIAHELKRRRAGHKPALRMLIRKAYEKREGKTWVFFPSRFSLRYLDNLKEKSRMSDYVFSCQYLNDPMPEGSSLFPATHVGFFKLGVYNKGNQSFRKLPFVNQEGEKQITPLPLNLNFFTVMDPSVGEASDSDFTAFVTVAVDSEFNMYVWDVRRRRVQADEMIAAMFSVYDEFHPKCFGIETVAFQKFLFHAFNRACQERNIFLSVQELHTDSTISKDMRIAGFNPYWKGRKVFLRVTENADLKGTWKELRYDLVADQDKLLDEAERFPLAATKDCLDALAYMPQVVFPAAHGPNREIQPGTMAWIEQMLDEEDPLDTRLRIN